MKGESSQVRALVLCHGSVSSRGSERVRAALERAGVRIETPDSRPRSVPGVLSFDRVDDGLLDDLASFSDRGRRRVVALDLRERPSRSDEVWSLLAAGAADVVTEKGSPKPMDQVAARLRRWCEVEALLESDQVRHGVVGSSIAWRAVLREIVEVAHFTNSPVLITGESGTGKELVARLIHDLDSRLNRRDLTVVDCTTVVPTLSGSEFFGHERGAFTGADAARDGAFALADKGTLFLDEVGELSLTLQAELLRVIQDGTYKRVGGNTWRKTSFRLVCATNRDIARDEAEGRFRRDLYFRIAAWTCHLPPLRDRRDDIVALAEHLVAEFMGRPLGLDPALRDFLQRRDYPGNVRDLKQLIGRLCARHVGDGPIGVGDIPETERPDVRVPVRSNDEASLEVAVRNALAAGLTLKQIGEEAKRVAVRMVLAQEEGSLARASRRLGVTSRALQLRRAADGGGLSSHDSR